MGEDSSRREDPRLARDAFMTRVEAIVDPSYRLASVMLLDYAAAEDAVHGATVRAWRQYRRLGGEVTSFRTWFLAIVANQCRRLRWRRPLAPRRRREAVGRTGDRVQDAIVHLPVGTRAALFCFYFLDLPLDEVARVLRQSPGRVRAQVYRASDRLQPRPDRGRDTVA
jgi:RNA polymerase sigma factor (sigma-70 family)